LLYLISIQGYGDVEKIFGESNMLDSDNFKKATFGSGCFWCTEAVFERVEGVHSVVSGYAGGDIENPTYEQICSGSTGHAEVTQITYDPGITTYDELLQIFWRTHDPTTLNRQGNDVGSQYRSVIFSHDDEQKHLAERYKEDLNASGAWKDPIVTEIVPLTVFYKSGAWKDPIVTEIVPLTVFYKAEDYHQNYYENNPNQGYCAFIIAPKLEKFEKVFKEKIKND
jgi:peptide-methionine (S)-S-oxide reductase